jgi:hypothetical protein
LTSAAGLAFDEGIASLLIEFDQLYYGFRGGNDIDPMA